MKLLGFQYMYLDFDFQKSSGCFRLDGSVSFWLLGVPLPNAYYPLGS